ncbi:hypothetical protein F8M41_004287 [Gigaspora margarita]|uniref:Uncharacterized protein n=1 Tax=Gigaspora margarita TaxID=4874 RepID=A0A8H4AXQ5_GIGMA|nr:hypothetical protein F8M41_004287 [Gigaspora margarita]
MDRKIIATFIALFAFGFTYLHATPLPRSAVGDKAGAVLEKLNGKFEVTQVDKAIVAINFEVNQGITENDPDHYFVHIGPLNRSFTELNIAINPPKAAAKDTGPGFVDDFINDEFSILKDNEILDSAKIVKE